MKKRMLAAVLAPLLLAACDSTTTPEGPFTLTFRGDASFQAPHGGQTIRAALVGNGVVLTEDAVVSAAADPSFTFTFTDAVVEGASYEVHYWIDSNFGGGSVDVCDPTSNDHQWKVQVPPLNDDRTVTDSHRPAEVEDACHTFAADLDFEGDGSFQAPHGGQPIAVAVVRAGDGAVITTMEGTVSPDADPSFSFSFPGALLKGVDYQVHYWIDSNFGGGTLGVCDPVNVDHQWSVDVPGTTDDAVTVSESHNPAAQSSVCASFN